MITQEVSLLVVGLFTLVTGIRVDWNTNQGPIVPPTPRTTVRPVPPFREPAPVWEDQSNDIPNPNPYVYVAPPPSRPRYNNNNNNNYNNNNNNNNNINYGILVPPAPNNGLNTYYQPSVSTVAGLAPKYVPGVGIQYYGIVPTQNILAASVDQATRTGTTITNIKSNDMTRGYYGDKIQGKYNAKTKKYKAYEKVKYGDQNQNFQQQQRQNYNNQKEDKKQQQHQHDEESSSQVTIVLDNNQDKSELEVQQLPFIQSPREFRQASWQIAENAAMSTLNPSWSHKKTYDNKNLSKNLQKSNYTNLFNAIHS